MAGIAVFGAIDTSGPGGLSGFATAQRTAGDVDLVQTTFTVISSALDLTVKAVAGDLLEYAVSGMFLAGVLGGEAHLLPQTINGSNVVINPLVTGTDGVPGWASLLEAQDDPISGSIFYVVQAGDIVSSNVKVRLYGKKSGTATHNISANTAVPLTVFLTNHGTPAN